MECGGKVGGDPDGKSGYMIYKIKHNFIITLYNYYYIKSNKNIKKCDGYWIF